MKKLLLILLCLPLLFNSCEEDDPTPSAAPPSSSAPCGNISVEADGVPLTHTISSITGCDIISIGTYDGNVISVAVSFISWNSGIPEWICDANLGFTDGSVINPPATYVASNPLTQPLISLTFNNAEANGTYSNQLVTNNNLIKNGSITITNIDYANNLIDGNFSFTGYQAIGALAKQINCTFSDVPFN